MEAFSESYNKLRQSEKDNNTNCIQSDQKENGENSDADEHLKEES